MISPTTSPSSVIGTLEKPSLDGDRDQLVDGWP